MGFRHYTHDAQIIYVDPRGKPHAAIVTAWWGLKDCTQEGETFGNGLEGEGEPGCNLVFVVGETDKKDPYGRQIERATSVVHKSKQSAHGNFWCWPAELEK